MPRPKKVGLDYFPVDVVWDEKMKTILSVFGNDGLSWVVSFWQTAYRDEFGRVNINKYFGEVLAKDSRNTPEKQAEIMKVAAEINLIKEIEPGIYTSNGIQKRIKEVSKERSSALSRYYAGKESTKERIKIKRENKEKIKKSRVKDFGDTSEKYLWKIDFSEYKKIELSAFNSISSNSEFIEERKKYHPYLDISKTIEKAHVDFWSTEAGWKNKKSSKSEEIDWPATYRNALTMKCNQVGLAKETTRVNGFDEAAWLERHKGEL
jgi:hypothetical protein